MAEPEIIGDIAFSEILDGIPNETFLVDAQLVDLTVTIDEEFLVNTILVNRIDETFLVNALTQQQNIDEEFFVDAILLQTNDEEFFIDASLILRPDEEFLVDAIIKRLGINGSCEPLLTFTDDFLTDKGWITTDATFMFISGAQKLIARAIPDNTNDTIALDLDTPARLGGKISDNNFQVRFVGPRKVV